MTANPMSSLPPLGPTTGMTPPPGGGPFKPVDPLRVLRRHRWLLVGLLILGVVLGAGTWYLLRQYRPVYTSTAKMEVTPRNPDAFDGMSSDYPTGPMEQVRAAIQSERERVLAESTLNQVLEHPEVRGLAWRRQFVTDANGEPQFNVTEARTALREMISVAHEPDSYKMPIKVSTQYRGDVEQILSTLISVYMNKVQATREGKGRETRATYQSAIDRAQERISNIEREIERRNRERNLENMENRRDQAKSTLANLKHNRIERSTELTEAEQLLETLKQQQNNGDTSPSSIAMQQVEAHHAVRQYDQRLRALRAEKDRLVSEGAGPNHDQVKSVEQQIEDTTSAREDEVGRLLREYRAAQLEDAAMRVASLRGRLTELDTQIEGASANLTDLQEQVSTLADQRRQIEQDLASAQQDKERAENKLDNVMVQQQHPGSTTVSLLTEPTNPELTSPRAMFIIPTVALLVLGLGTGGLFLKEMLDQRLRSPADVKLIDQADLIGLVPDASEDRSGARRIEGAVARHPKGLMAEAFRQVRTVVMGKMERRAYKTMLIAGARPGTGTSTLVHNLACSLAYHGRRTLLIDANLRRPAQHRLNDIAQAPGLVEVLQGDRAPRDVIVPLEDMSLSVLPAGDLHDGPPELLAGSAMRGLLNELESEYDIILLDAPPALLAADTQLLARSVDAMVLLARADTDKRGTIQRMLRELDGLRGDVLGLVLNRARSSSGGYFRESYEEFYRYSSNGHHRNGRHRKHDKRAPQRQRTRPIEPSEQTEEQEQGRA